MTNLCAPVVAAAVAVALFAGFNPAQEKPKPAEQPKKPTVMQRKLAHAQKVLEGLALNDFDKISTNADELAQCAREASWRVLKTPKYELYSNDFVRNLEGMKTAAKKRNVDAAALAYVDMTLTCVKCHQYVREEGIGLAPDLGPLDPKVAAK
jgi:hypothetical protein